MTCGKLLNLPRLSFRYLQSSFTNPYMAEFWEGFFILFMACLIQKVISGCEYLIRE